MNVDARSNGTSTQHTLESVDEISLVAVGFVALLINNSNDNKTATTTTTRTTTATSTSTTMTKTTTTTTTTITKTTNHETQVLP